MGRIRLYLATTLEKKKKKKKKKDGKRIKKTVLENFKEKFFVVLSIRSQTVQLSKKEYEELFIV